MPYTKQKNITIFALRCHSQSNPGALKLCKYSFFNLVIKKIRSPSSNYLTLQNTLEIFFQDEHLNDFKCEKCENIGVCIKRKIVKLPRVLILHLKRYQFQEIEVENEMEAIFNDAVLPDSEPLAEASSKIMYAEYSLPISF